MDIVERIHAPDGSVKYALKTDNGGLIEAVYYKFAGYDVEKRPLLDSYRYQSKHPDYGICISTQVGCAMGCKFCATGYGGFFSNLKASELIQQLDIIHHDIISRGIEPEDSIGNVVTMGMGEPLMNYNNVVSLCQSIKKEDGKRFIPLVSVSTIGILPSIKRLASVKDINIKLYFSIHSPFDKQRNILMPINLQYPLHKVIQACIEYSKERKEKIVACYLLIKDFNETRKHAEALAAMLSPDCFDLQLLTFNPIKESSYERSEKTDKFKEYVEECSDLLIDVRISKGQEVQGGCGQLVQSHSGKSIRLHKSE